MITVPAGEPAGWRDIPDVYTGTLDPNYYCRHWNAKRQKYCRARAGAGTEHPGQGRCRHAGGLTPIKHGLYSVITRPRVAELIAHAERTGTTDTMPELHAARALFIEWIERYDERTQALVAWHASFTPAMRPIPEDLVHALETVVDELEALRGPADLTDGEEDLDEVSGAIRNARRLITVLQVVPEAKPREMPDLADGHRILDTVSKIIERREKLLLAKAVTAENFNRVMGAMGAVVKDANGELDPDARLERIRAGWDAIRIA